MRNILEAKRYLFASDFDKTLSFNDSGYVLSEMLGISEEEFERKAEGMAAINLVQQGGELAYLLLHDPEYRTTVRPHHLREVGKRIRLKHNIALLYQFLTSGVDGYHFDFYVTSAAPVEIVRSALEGIIPADHIYGTEFEYGANGEIQRLKQVTAGYGKVAVLDRLQANLKIGPDRIVYVGDGSSDIHVMLHVNRRDGFTIAVSKNKYIAPIAQRTILSDDAMGVMVPILEDIVGLNRIEIRQLFEASGFLIQEWDKVQTDWLTITPSADLKLEALQAAAE